MFETFHFQMKLSAVLLASAAGCLVCFAQQIQQGAGRENQSLDRIVARLGQDSAYSRAEARIEAKYPQEFAKIAAEIADAEKQMNALAEKIAVELPKTAEQTDREARFFLRENKAAIDKLLEAAKTDSAKAYRDFQSLAREKGIQIRRQMANGSGANGMTGARGNRGIRNNTSGATVVSTEPRKEFVNRDIWPDNNGAHINAHGGWILKVDDTFYWYGEYRPVNGMEDKAVKVYTSNDLYNWTDAGLAFRQNAEYAPGISRNSLLERPKVVYNEKTKKYVLWYHFEPGGGYNSASTATAVSDSPLGPFRIVRTGRPNVKTWPLNAEPELKAYIDGTNKTVPNRFRRMIENFNNGQESRDMTIFKDDDGKAYLVHSSENNMTMHITELTDDYQDFTGRWWYVFKDKQYEAPVIFKKDGKYYFFGSGCTGWNPNAAKSAVADQLTGPWKELGNPAVDEGGNITYSGQSAFSYTLPDGTIIAAFDIWRPQGLHDSRYLWLKVEWENGRPVVHNSARWSYPADALKK